MAPRRTVYVALLDEATDEWRPVEAEHVQGDEYVLYGPIPDDEAWEFQPGDVVHCRERTSSTGTAALGAFSKSTEQTRRSDQCEDP